MRGRNEWLDAEASRALDALVELERARLARGRANPGHVVVSRARILRAAVEAYLEGERAREGGS